MIGKLKGLIDSYGEDYVILDVGGVGYQVQCSSRTLQAVQGVGAKVALAVLSTLPPSDLANAIALRDKAAVTRTPGVGPKVAELLVTELKDKAPAFANVDPAL